ncbi:MAG: M20/M25/M40 family metallo-hydrolase, partial [Victivallaceae bacterium]
MYTLLKTKNEGLKEETLGFLTELLRSPSQEGNESKAAEIVKQEMIKQNYDKVYQDNAGNIIGIIYGMNAGPTLVLNSHLDTVILDRDSEWKFPPYAGHCENGRIYGAGASDCKGGIAAQVFAGALLKRSLLPLKGNLVVTATTAEGNGRSCGVKYLLEETLPSFGL